MWWSDGNKKVDLTNDLSVGSAGGGTGEEEWWRVVLRVGEVAEQ